MLRTCEVRWDTGIPTHGAVCLQFEHGSKEALPVWVPGSKPKDVVVPEDQWRAADVAAWAPYQHAFDQALEQSRLDAAWDAFEAAAQDYQLRLEGGASRVWAKGRAEQRTGQPRALYAWRG